jgi:hypothetical protein
MNANSDWDSIPPSDSGRITRHSEVETADVVEVLAPSKGQVRL